VRGTNRGSFGVASRWWNGGADITIEELLGTKTP
jgi:hypothetical protein